MPHPFADLGPTIVAELGGESAIVVRRHAAGSWVNGVWVEGATTNTSTNAVVQPSTPREIERLPEAERAREAITVFTTAPLVASDVANAVRGDEIEWQGRVYEVYVVEDWSAQAGYGRAIAARVGV